jgi:hypothetical protein
VKDERSPHDDSPHDDQAAVEETERRRRRARVFGEVLPDRTRDEMSDAAEDSAGASEEWLRRQKPPHHD